MIRSFLSDLRQQPLWFAAFLALLVLLPLPFGSNRPWASDLAALISGGLLLWMLWAQRAVAPPAGIAPRKRLALAAGGFSLVFLWSVAQTLSFLPQTLHHPLWNEATALLGALDGAVTVDRGAFAEALLRFVTMIALFLLALTGCREGSRAKLLIRALVGAGVVYALYGLLAHAAGGDTILWFKKWAYRGFLTSTFVNKNSYAVYAGFGLLASLPWVWARVADKKTDALLAKKSRVLAWVMALTIKDYLVFLVPLVMLAALALTGSRAGLFSVMAGLLVYLFAMAIHRRRSARGVLALSVGGIAFLFLFLALGGDALQERMDQGRLDADTTMRFAAYQLEAQAISDNPVLGFGLGSFDSAFKLYRDETLQNWFHHAHNDYLEMIMDLGLPVALILFASIALLISCCASALRTRKRDGHYAALALGASAMLLIHALVDFSFHIPAIAGTYAAILGLGVAQSWSTRVRG